MTSSALTASEEHLSERNRAFLDHIWDDPSGGGTAAAIAAGHPAANAGRTARRLLKRPEIQAALKARHEAWHAVELVDSGWLMRRLVDDVSTEVSDIIDAESGVVLPVKDWPRRAQRMVTKIVVEERFEGEGKDRRCSGYVKTISFDSRGTRLKMIGDHCAVRAFLPPISLVGNVTVDLRDFSGGRAGGRPHELGAIEIGERVAEGDTGQGADQGNAEAQIEAEGSSEE